MGQETWAIGVDLGGTKVEVALVDTTGRILQRQKKPTDIKGGPDRIIAEISQMVQTLKEEGPASAPVGVGVGVAGQISADTGVVRFSPNLGWRDVPLKEKLKGFLDLPVVVTNDVRAATWGEWFHGAGAEVDDLICLFIGTGIGGGVVSGGRVLTGASNTAGELGHMTIDLHGPVCTCGNRGCMEALAGGWAIARRAQKAINDSPAAGAAFLKTAGLKSPFKDEDLTAKIVAEAAQAGDPLARLIVDEVTNALIAGGVALVNAFNPSRLILGGGVLKGLPELPARLEEGIRRSALEVATADFKVVRAQLGNNAGVVGAASLAFGHFRSGLKQDRCV
jgi:glucokinase